MVRQRGYRAVALAFLLCLLGAGAARAQCSTQQNSPAFTAGGSVFGRTAPQWNQYFAAKVDANNGIACNLTILGTLNLNYGQIVAALGYVPTPLGVITGGTDTLIASASTTDLGALPTNPQSDVTVTGNATISSFGTSTPIGQLKVVTFTGTPTLVYNVSSMILPGAANLVVTAKSLGTFKSLGSGNWTMVSYNDASGSPISVVPVAKGGTGLSSGTSGGVLAFTAAGTIASSGALTANMPVIGGGAGAVPTVGTVSGTGTVFALATSPTFVTPALGTIASGNLSAGTVTATGGTTNSALAGRFGNMLDLVKDFAADPLGISDTCALLATITTTRPIHVPTGKYLCSTNQTITVNLNLWGDGAAEYNQGAAVPSATGIQGTWLYRTTNVGLTISIPSPPSGYVSGGIRNLALAETQPAVNITAGPTSDGKGFTGTSGAAVLSVSNTTGLTAGMGVTNTTNTAYIPPGSTILSVVANTSITISNNLTHNLANTDVLNFWKPTVYDPFIQLVNAQGEFDIDGVYCYGVYRCVSDGGAAGGGRLNVQHVRGQSFLHMIELENQFDSVVWRDVRDWCYWSCNAAVYNWMLTNGEAFTVAGVDGLAASDIFAIGKKACLRFKVSAVNPGHVTQGGQFSNFYCDFSKYGVWNTGVVTQFQMVNAIINGGGYAVGTTAQSTAIQDDGDGANGSGVVAYISSLRCDAMSVACVNGANATSGGSIQVDNLLVQNFIGTDYVKAVTSTGPYYLNIGQVQLSNSSGNYFAINNAILSGFTLNNGATSSSQILQIHHRYDSTGNETALLVDNKSIDTGSGTCAAVWATTNVSQSYSFMKTCNNGSASLAFGSGVTSPVIAHPGGTLAIGDVSATSILTPTLTSGGSPAATLAFATSFPNWLFGQSNSGGISQLKVSNTGSGAGTYAEVTAATHGSGNYYMQFYVDEGGTEGVLSTGSNLTTGMRLQSASGGIRVDGVNTTTPAGGKNAVCADTGAQPVKIYISSGVTC